MKSEKIENNAYMFAAGVVKGEMQRDAPLTAQALEEITASDLIIVGGCYDHVERVLAALEVPFKKVSDQQLSDLNLSSEQLLIINCPGNLPEASLRQVAKFVESGGTLFTTDWALRNVIEPAFPGIIEYNDTPTGDDVVRIEVLDPKSPYLQGVMDVNDDPQWWLEGSSYPIRILDEEKVRVLITSKELGEKYGEEAVAVVFRHGDGEVFHMISHYYLQRSDFRSERHEMSAADYANAKDVPMTAAMLDEADDLKYGLVEAAGSSARLMANIIGEKKRKEKIANQTRK